MTDEGAETVLNINIRNDDPEAIQRLETWVNIAAELHAANPYGADVLIDATESDVQPGLTALAKAREKFGVESPFVDIRG